MSIDSPLVQEVVTFVREGALLAPREVPFTHPGVEPIHDMDRAMQLAWDECYGPNGSTWTDIREKEIGRISTGQRELQQQFEPLFDQFSQLLIKRLKRGPHWELLDDIHGDLYWSAFHRALQADTDSFFERIFQVYKAGGWPCGWSGEYPDGKLVAYFPPGPGQG